VFEAGEGSALGGLVLTTGEGADKVRVGPYVSIGGSVSIDLGPGANELDWVGQSLARLADDPRWLGADRITLDGLDVSAS
jgi:hypothetical protein